MMRTTWLAIGFGFAACWTSSQPATPLHEDPVPSPTKSTEFHATIRIDATPGGKKEQPVWLEFGPDKRWLIDYRPRELWRNFEDAEVIVTGICYQPFGQALAATHFKVDRLRLASAPIRAVPFLEIGPEVVLNGEFVVDVPHPGSKREGSDSIEFRSNDGTTYAIAGNSTVSQPELGAAAVSARRVELNLAYAATTGGPQIWILAIHDPGYTPDNRDTPKPCPG